MILKGPQRLQQLAEASEVAQINVLTVTQKDWMKQLPQVKDNICQKIKSLQIWCGVCTSQMFHILSHQITDFND